jgi:hypothetical protein
MNAEQIQYVADYLREELNRAVSPAMFGEDLDQFGVDIDRHITDALEAYKGGAR